MENETLAQMHLEIGNVYFKNEEFDKAEKEYKKAMEEEKLLKHVYLQRGKINHIIGNYDKAIKEFEKCLKIDPSKEYDVSRLINLCKRKIEIEQNRKKKAKEIERYFEKIKGFKVDELLAEKLPIIKKLNEEKKKELGKIEDVSYEIFKIFNWAKREGFDDLINFSYEEWKKCDIHDFEYE